MEQDFLIEEITRAETHKEARKVLNKKEPKPLWREYVEVILISLVAAILLRLFVVSAYRVESGSMEDSLFEGYRIYKSSDNGQNWAWIGPPGRNGDMYDIAVDPSDSNVLYLPRRAHGIVKSSDGGESWTSINQGLLNVGINLLAVAGSGTIYAASVHGEGTFKTTNYGNSWVNINEGGITHPWADELVIDPHDPETIWEVADVGEVFKSTNGGVSWDKVIDSYGEGFRFGSLMLGRPC